MKYRSRKEIAELVLLLKNNLDEAEQFEPYVDEIIKHCEKEYLIYILEQMCEDVEYNIELFENGRIYSSNICDDPEELKKIIKEIRGNNRK